MEKHNYMSTSSWSGPWCSPRCWWTLGVTDDQDAQDFREPGIKRPLQRSRYEVVRVQASVGAGEMETLEIKEKKG